MFLTVERGENLAVWNKPAINIIQIIFLNDLVPDVDVEKAENLKLYVQLVEIAQLIMDPYLGKLV